MMQERLRSSVEDAKKEKALKEVAKATMQEKVTVLEATEGKARELEGVHVLAKQRATNLEVKLGEMELRASSQLGIRRWLS